MKDIMRVIVLVALVPVLRGAVAAAAIDTKPRGNQAQGAEKAPTKKEQEDASAAKKKAAAAAAILAKQQAEAAAIANAKKQAVAAAAAAIAKQQADAVAAAKKQAEVATAALAAKQKADGEAKKANAEAQAAKDRTEAALKRRAEAIEAAKNRQALIDEKAASEAKAAQDRANDAMKRRVEAVTDPSKNSTNAPRGVDLTSTANGARSADLAPKEKINDRSTKSPVYSREQLSKMSTEQLSKLPMNEVIHELPPDRQRRLANYRDGKDDASSYAEVVEAYKKSENQIKTAGKLANTAIGIVLPPVAIAEGAAQLVLGKDVVTREKASRLEGAVQVITSVVPGAVGKGGALAPKTATALELKALESVKVLDVVSTAKDLAQDGASAITAAIAKPKADGEAKKADAEAQAAKERTEAALKQRVEAATDPSKNSALANTGLKQPVVDAQVINHESEGERMKPGMGHQPAVQRPPVDPEAAAKIKQAYAEAAEKRKQASAEAREKIRQTLLNRAKK
jgi:hypothetical protein